MVVRASLARKRSDKFLYIKATPVVERLNALLITVRHLNVGLSYEAWG